MAKVNLSPESVDQLKAKHPNMTDDEIQDIVDHLQLVDEAETTATAPATAPPPLSVKEASYDQVLQWAQAHAGKKELGLTDIMMMEMWEDIMERRRAKTAGGGTGTINPQVDSRLTSMERSINTLLERDRRKEEAEERRKDMEPILARMTSLEQKFDGGGRKATEEDSPTMQTLKTTIQSLEGKIEGLETSLQDKQLQGWRTGLIDEVKSTTDSVRTELAEVKGRLDGIGAASGKGTDRAVMREMKVLGGIDTKLDVLMKKLPDAKEALELAQKMQPQTPRTGPTRTIAEREATLREVAAQIEADEKTKTAGEEQPHAQPTDPPKAKAKEAKK